MVALVMAPSRCTATVGVPLQVERRARTDMITASIVICFLIVHLGILLDLELCSGEAALPGNVNGYPCGDSLAVQSLKILTNYSLLWRHVWARNVAELYLVPALVSAVFWLLVSLASLCSNSVRSSYGSGGRLALIVSTKFACKASSIATLALWPGAPLSSYCKWYLPFEGLVLLGQSVAAPVGVTAQTLAAAADALGTFCLCWQLSDRWPYDGISTGTVLASAVAASYLSLLLAAWRDKAAEAREKRALAATVEAAAGTAAARGSGGAQEGAVVAAKGEEEGPLGGQPAAQGLANAAKEGVKEGKGAAAEAAKTGAGEDCDGGGLAAPSGSPAAGGGGGGGGGSADAARREGCCGCDCDCACRCADVTAAAAPCTKGSQAAVATRGGGDGGGTAAAAGMCLPYKSCLGGAAVDPLLLAMAPLPPPPSPSPCRCSYSEDSDGGFASGSFNGNAAAISGGGGGRMCGRGGRDRAQGCACVCACSTPLRAVGARTSSCGGDGGGDGVMSLEGGVRLPTPPLLLSVRRTYSQGDAHSARSSHAASSWSCSGPATTTLTVATVTSAATRSTTATSASTTRRACPGSIVGTTAAERSSASLEAGMDVSGSYGVATEAGADAQGRPVPSDACAAVSLPAASEPASAAPCCSSAGNYSGRIARCRICSGGACPCGSVCSGRRSAAAVASPATNTAAAWGAPTLRDAGDAASCIEWTDALADANRLPALNLEEDVCPVPGGPTPALPAVPSSFALARALVTHSGRSALYGSPALLHTTCAIKIPGLTPADVRAGGMADRVASLLGSGEWTHGSAPAVTPPPAASGGVGSPSVAVAVYVREGCVELVADLLVPSEAVAAEARIAAAAAAAPAPQQDPVGAAAAAAAVAAAVDPGQPQLQPLAEAAAHPAAQFAAAEALLTFLERRVLPGLGGALPLPEGVHNVSLQAAAGGACGAAAQVALLSAGGGILTPLPPPSPPPVQQLPPTIACVSPCCVFLGGNSCSDVTARDAGGDGQVLSLTVSLAVHGDDGSRPAAAPLPKFFVRHGGRCLPVVVRPTHSSSTPFAAAEALPPAIPAASSSVSPSVQAFVVQVPLRGVRPGVLFLEAAWDDVSAAGGGAGVSPGHLTGSAPSLALSAPWPVLVLGDALLAEEVSELMPQLAATAPLRAVAAAAAPAWDHRHQQPQLDGGAMSFLLDLGMWFEAVGMPESVQDVSADEARAASRGAAAAAAAARGRSSSDGSTTSGWASSSESEPEAAAPPRCFGVLPNSVDGAKRDEHVAAATQPIPLHSGHSSGRRNRGGVQHHCSPHPAIEGLPGGCNVINGGARNAVGMYDSRRAGGGGGSGVLYERPRPELLHGSLDCTTEYERHFRGGVAMQSSTAGLGLRLLRFTVTRGWPAASALVLRGLQVHCRMRFETLAALFPSGAAGMPLLHTAVTSGRLPMVRAVVSWSRRFRHPMRWDEPAGGGGGLTALHLAAVLEDGGRLAAAVRSIWPEAAALWSAVRDADGRTPLDYEVNMRGAGEATVVAAAPASQAAAEGELAEAFAVHGDAGGAAGALGLADAGCAGAGVHGSWRQGMQRQQEGEADVRLRLQQWQSQTEGELGTDAHAAAILEALQQSPQRQQQPQQPFSQPQPDPKQLFPSRLLLDLWAAGGGCGGGGCGVEEALPSPGLGAATAVPTASTIASAPVTGSAAAAAADRRALQGLLEPQTRGCHQKLTAAEFERCMSEVERVSMDDCGSASAGAGSAWSRSTMTGGPLEQARPFARFVSSFRASAPGTSGAPHPSPIAATASASATTSMLLTSAATLPDAGVGMAACGGISSGAGGGGGGGLCSSSAAAALTSDGSSHAGLTLGHLFTAEVGAAPPPLPLPAVPQLGAPQPQPQPLRGPVRAQSAPARRHQLQLQPQPQTQGHYPGTHAYPNLSSELLGRPTKHPGLPYPQQPQPSQLPQYPQPPQHQQQQLLPFMPRHPQEQEQMGPSCMATSDCSVSAGASNRSSSSGVASCGSSRLQQYGYGTADTTAGMGPLGGYPCSTVSAAAAAAGPAVAAAAAAAAVKGCYAASACRAAGGVGNAMVGATVGLAADSVGGTGIAAGHLPANGAELDAGSFVGVATPAALAGGSKAAEPTGWLMSGTTTQRAAQSSFQSAAAAAAATAPSAGGEVHREALLLPAWGSGEEVSTHQDASTAGTDLLPPQPCPAMDEALRSSRRPAASPSSTADTVAVAVISPAATSATAPLAGTLPLQPPQLPRPLPLLAAERAAAGAPPSQPQPLPCIDAPEERFSASPRRFAYALDYAPLGCPAPFSSCATVHQQQQQRQHQQQQLDLRPLTNTRLDSGAAVSEAGVGTGTSTAVAVAAATLPGAMAATFAGAAVAPRSDGSASGAAAPDGMAAAGTGTSAVPCSGTGGSDAGGAVDLATAHPIARAAALGPVSECSPELGCVEAASASSSSNSRRGEVQVIGRGSGLRSTGGVVAASAPPVLQLPQQLLQRRRPPVCPPSAPDEQWSSGSGLQGTIAAVSWLQRELRAALLRRLLPASAPVLLALLVLLVAVAWAACCR